MDTQPLVSVRNLDRSFENVHAVRGISFDILPGQVVGFIGTNGAGKTTTMRMMATLDVPSYGTISIGGHDTQQHPELVRKIIGWMPDNHGTYPYMTVFEYLDFFARAYGLKGHARQQRLDEVMHFADLTPLADRNISELSKGLDQRLCISRMLIPDPDLLILDEPTEDLDPKARREFKNYVRLLAQRGKTLFISSHILTELGEICDILLFIDVGKIVYRGEAEALRRDQAPGAKSFIVDISVAHDLDALIQWVALHHGWNLLETKPDGARLALTSDNPQDLTIALRQMILDGLPVTEFHRQERRLEEALVDKLKGKCPGLLPHKTCP
jgi:ABC-2 type transport system ATP-binding protein